MDKAVNRATIYRITKAVKDGKNTHDQRKFNAIKTKRTQSLIAAVAAAVEEDHRVSIEDLAGPMGCQMEPFSTSFLTIWAWLRSLPDG